MRIIILGSGSKGNSTVLISNGKTLLIDVGFSFPRLSKLLDQYHLRPNDIDGVLITHTHKDHILGLSTLVKKTSLKVYTNSQMFEELVKIVPEERLIVNDEAYMIDGFNIDFIYTSHDAIGSIGFIINDSLVYVTDTGYLSQKNLKKLINKKIYIFESNHDINMLMTGPYPYILKQRVVSDRGHLSNEQAGTYLKELIGSSTKEIVLAHLSETNNTHDIALQTVKEILKVDIPLYAASQDESFDMGELDD